ncbi:hypothetical protein AC1031_012347 [Aphanomyces cochlioides]|nr:hypothetical protein AC1031_012347 [Aphanomyces cochlioides]
MAPPWDTDKCKCDECLMANSNGRSSLDLLVSWITACDAHTGEYTNWTDFKGGSKSKRARSKTTITAEIATMMLRHGVCRDANAIKAKIASLNSKFQKAEDWKNSTGAGLRDIAVSNINENLSVDELKTTMAETNSTIERAILEICPQYNVLSPVFGSRPLSKPVFHSSTDEALDMDGVADDNASEFECESEREDQDEKQNTIESSNLVGYIESPSLVQGSPPQKGGRIKRLKLERVSKQKSFGETIAAAMDKRTVATLQSQEAMMQVRQEETKLRQSEASFHRELKLQELAVLTREKRHQEIIAEAKLMVDVGIPKEEILNYIRSEKALLEG